jgi:putative phage-type endonuclease
MTALPKEMELIQGTTEWLQFRKTKITATDAVVIMGTSPWKNRTQLYNEKTSDCDPSIMTPRMQRGIDLEPIARSLFTIQTGIEVEPRVIVKDWAMASLDGISECGRYLVEIKCPNENDHALAVMGKVPSHYHAQLQHQMWVCDVDKMFYFSFDGIDGVLIEVEKDEKYVEKMIEEEYKFYQCLINRIPPEQSEKEFVEREDEIWKSCVDEWKLISQNIKQLEEKQEILRKRLIFLSGESNTKGAGISLSHIQRKGNVDYSKIPQLKNVDLEMYRKPSTNTWRISSD